MPLRIYERDPIDREDYGERASRRVKDAQYLLAGNSPVASKLTGHRKTYNGKLDGITGPATLAAARAMKYALGYPMKECHATFGQQLYDLLMGKRRQTLTMKARARARIPKPVPTWSYPIEGGPRKIIGFPYQGTHRRGNWQSDRGYDLACPLGTYLLAPKSGRIGSRWGDMGKGGVLFGKRIYVEVGNGQQFYLAHASTLIARPGQRVVAGQRIAISNFPAIPHLHVTTNMGDPAREILGWGRVLRRLAGLLPNPESHGDIDYGED